MPVFKQDTLYGAHGKFTAAVTPPVLVAIVLGITWKRYTPAAAFATITGGALLILASFFFPNALVGPFDFGMGPDSYKFMRALFGLVASGVLGVSVSLFTKPKPPEQIKGLIAGTQLDAMRQFKGSEPNRKPGSKATVRIVIDETLSGDNTIIVSQSTLDKMAANPGDLLYASHIKWYYGGLRSVHITAGQPAPDSEEQLMHISPEDAKTAHFTQDQKVTVEKIM